MTGPELEVFATELNGGATISDTLLLQYLNLAKALVEQMRPWMILRKTDTSKSVTSGNTWQTAIDLSGITDFSRFYETDTSAPIKLFDGINRIEPYRQVPWDQRLYYKDVPNTFVFDEANKQLYLNGIVSFAGTLYIDYIQNSADITNDDSSSWIFPSWAHPLLGFYAVAINKGGVDYDDINARMAPDNRAQAQQIINMLSSWDNAKQQSALTNIDPYNRHTNGFRSGAINMD
jgi:hypothetical protein